MDVLKLETRPSSFNILKKYYTNVAILKEHLQTIVSDKRFSRIVEMSTANEDLRKLIETTYICRNRDRFVEDEDADETSMISAENSNQGEVCIRFMHILMTGRESRAVNSVEAPA
jgi:hypothetical protein